MRDVGQPCFQAMRSGGIDECAKVCRQAGGCAESKSGLLDVEGVSDTCPVRAFEATLVKCGIGRRERTLLVDDIRGTKPLQPTQPLDVVRAWLEQKPKPNLLILGGTKGIGKTVAACFALSRFSRTFPGRYVLSSDVVDPKVRIKRLANYALLVVDQVGHEYVASPEWCESRFSELVVRRDSDMLPTIFVGNLDEEAFRGRYKSLVGDRVDGDGEFRIFKAPSLRGQV